MDICSTRALNEQGSPCSNLTKGQREAKEWNIFKKEKKNHQTGKQLLTYRPKSSCKGKGGGGWRQCWWVWKSLHHTSQGRGGKSRGAGLHGGSVALKW